MRITNKMMNYDRLSNMNANKTTLDRLNSQMSTEKKIARLSDDPVVGIRALRLRGNLSEVTQYYGANVPDAVAWVDVTQKAIDSTTGILSSMKSLCVQGANGTYEASSRKKIYEELKADVKQIYQNGNADYAGRTVFTGYRTGESMTFLKDTVEDYIDIKDTFNASDITVESYVESPFSTDSINSLSVPAGTGETSVREDRVNRIRLSYDDLNRAVKTYPGVYTGTQIGTSGTLASNTWSRYFNEDGTITDDGKGFTENVVINGENLAVKLDQRGNQGLILSKDPVYFPLDTYTKPATPTQVKKTGEELKVTYGELVYTIKEVTPGTYTADKDAKVTNNGDGTLTLTIPGASSDIYTEIKVKADGSQVISDNKYSIVADTFIRGKDQYCYYHAGDMYAVYYEDVTSLAYRAELEKTPSIPEDSVVFDQDGQLRSFEIEYNGETYKIHKFEGEEAFWAVNSAGVRLDWVKVTENSDKTVSVEIPTDTLPSATYTPATEPTAWPRRVYGKNVFNVSASGQTFTSSYHETILDAKITTSDAAVATDSSGNDLTAYQYLALNDADKNSDPAAAKAVYLLADTGEVVFGSDVARTLKSLKDIPGVDTISITYDKSSFSEGDLRPEHFLDSRKLDGNHLMIDPLVYDDQEQAIYYSVGSDQKIQINTNAKDVFDTQIIRQVDDILTAIEGVDEAEDKVNRIKTMQEKASSYSVDETEKLSLLLDAANKELDIAKNKLQSVYERSVEAFGSFHYQATLAGTACGTTDERLTLISNRLQEEQSTVKILASENENVDITNVAIQVTESEKIYNSALMATGKISQHTLLNYL
ncbi:MAG: hypothetical protein J5829_01225 [Lachnospiraceae bacterium]|nr:hypothetical protein [Lachnospiraceae bacterium]